MEGRVDLRLPVGVLEFFERGHQDLGDILAPVRTEVPAPVGLRRNHGHKAALMNIFIRLWSLRPGEVSIPEHVSTPHGFAFFNPPPEHFFFFFLLTPTKY